MSEKLVGRSFLLVGWVVAAGRVVVVEGNRDLKQVAFACHERQNLAWEPGSRTRFVAPKIKVKLVFQSSRTALLHLPAHIIYS